MRLVVTGGGTGGHIYPALAVAAEWRSRGKDSALYIGKADGLESELAVQSGIPFKGLSFYGMPRGFSLTLPFRFLCWLRSLRRAQETARRMLQDFQPDVVFGTGGYVSAPVLLAARTLKIPYVLHEPDAYPGLANRLLAPNARAVTTGFAEGARAFPSRETRPVLVTGNPIRNSIGRMKRPKAQASLGLSCSKRVLLVTGGSQGARRINRALTEALPVLLGELDLAVLHVTGKTLYDETLSALEPSLKNHPDYHVMSYAAQMPELLAAADIAVCRAGSMSLSEMYACGIPTILVPYPYAAADHQHRNAMASVQAGASRMIEDADCTGERLVNELRSLLRSADHLARMRQAALALGHPDATREIVRHLRSMTAPLQRVLSKHLGAFKR